MYPIVKDGVTFYYDDEQQCYYVRNARKETYEISRDLFKALRNADGTHPLQMPDADGDLLTELEEAGLVRTSRFEKCYGPWNILTLFPIGRVSKKTKIACRAITVLLPVLSTAAVLVSVFLWKSGLLARRVSSWGPLNLWIYYAIFIAAIALHEAGHLAACIAYGYPVRETGVLLYYVLPLGAYVSHRDKKSGRGGKEDDLRKERIRIALAGVEVNLIIMGVCFLAAVLYEPLSCTLHLEGQTVIWLVLANLVPMEGLDGEHALSAVFDTKSLAALAEKCLRSEKRRRKLLREGPAGCVCFVILLVVLYARILLYIVLVLSFVFPFLLG